MNRAIKRSVKQENYEHVLMCLICRSLFDDHDHQPKFLPCHHTFCKECLREYVRQMGDDIECPSCRKLATIPAAGVAALQTNFYAKYIQSLVYGCGAGGEGLASECESHPSQKLQHLCRDCVRSVCGKCLEEGECVNHKLVSLTTATEEYHQKIDAAFAGANSLIERKKVELEALLKSLSEEKDESLLKIDSVFEQYIHTLNRRSTLLKNKVIDIYNEHTTKLDADLEEISTAMTCIVSLKEYHETMISRGDFTDVDKGIEELNEVCSNIQERIRPQKSQIVFEDRHGADKFRGCVKDLGRVMCKSLAVVVKPEENVSNEANAGGVQSPVITPNKFSDSDDVNSECAGANLSTAPSAGKSLEGAAAEESKVSVPNKMADGKTCKEPGSAETTQNIKQDTVVAKSSLKHEANKCSQYSRDSHESKAESSISGSSTVKADGRIAHVNNNELSQPELSQLGSKHRAEDESEFGMNPDYWVPTSGSLDAINAEMGAEQTSL